MNINDITNITIETSTLCNAKCIICPNHTKSREFYLTPLEDFKNTLLKFPNLKIVSLCGMYEPLSDNRLPQILDIIKDVNPKMEIVIFTNASLLHKWDDLILANENISSIIFSVHGLSQNIYDRVMKGLDVDKTYNNIIIFCNKRKHKTVKTPKTTVSFIRTSENIKELGYFIKFWNKYVDNVSNYELMNWNGNTQNYNELYDKEKKSLRACPMFENPLVIDAHGNVVRCCYNFEFSYGNVKENGIENWLSKKRVSTLYPSIDCFKCDGWKI
jgi:MoaA/NifB/PqqE/SkfB family radical SAM enzyme